MDDLALRLALGDLNAAYADCIDDDRLEEWPDFFVEDCRYLITDRTSHEAGLRHGIIYAASKGMLADRVMAMRGANIFEPHRYRHLVGPARIQQWLTIDPKGNATSGKFTIDQWDEAGNLLGHVQGNVIGPRVTMETGFQSVE